MKWKQVCKFAVILFCLLSFGGCTDRDIDPADTRSPHASSNEESSEPQKNWVLPEIAPDFFMVLCENQDVTFNSLSYTNNISYTVISAMPVTTEDITVCFDRYIPFNYELSMEQEAQKLPDYIFASYQSMSWEEVACLMKNDDTEAVNGLMEPVLEAYHALPEEQLPSLYLGTLAINFLNRTALENVELKELQIQYAGCSYTYALEHFSFSQEMPEINDSGILFCDTLSLTDINVLPGKDGKFRFDNLNFKASEELVIDEITFYDAEQTKISSVEVSQQLADGTNMNYLWEGETPIPLAKGDTIAIAVNGYDPIFSNTFAANATRFMLIKYTSHGVPSTIYVELTFRMRQDAFMSYAYLVDHLDMMSFYVDYMPLLLEAGGEEVR